MGLSVKNKGGFREVVEEYCNENPADVSIIDDQVDIRYETTAISALNAPRISLFRNLVGYPGFRLVSNILGSEQRILYFTGCVDRPDFLKKWKRALERAKESLNTEIIDSAPFKENIMKGNEVDLLKLPIPIHYKGDGSKLMREHYITSGLVVTRNPSDNSILNMGYCRIQILDRNKFAFDAGSKGHTWSYFRRHIDSGTPLDFSVVIGVHPALYLLAAGFMENEYGASYEFTDLMLAKGISNDIPVPADSEIVLEATFDPTRRADEGPFSEYTGYMGYDTTGFVAECKTIMHRDQPIYYDILPSNSDEHINIFSYPRSLIVEDKIRQSLPAGSEIHVEWPPYGSRFLALGYAESKAGDIALQAALGVVSNDPLWGKIVLFYRGKGSLELPGFLASLAVSKRNSFSNVVILPPSFIIASDVGSGGSARSSRMVAILDPCHYEVQRKTGETVILAKNHKAVIAYDPSDEGDLEILVPEEIDPGNMQQVGWVLATRVNPGIDVKIDEARLTMDARRVRPQVPEIPDEVWRLARSVVERCYKNRGANITPPS